MNVATLDLRELAQDGDILKMDDGRSLRLRIETDPDTTVSDYPDAYGRVAWTTRDPYRYNDAPRPAGFDGKARKMSTQSASYWWQPPEDVPADQVDSLASLVRDLVNYGFSAVIVELLDGSDAYGRLIVVDVASLWGIDSLDDGYLATVVADLVDELTF